MSWAQHLEKHDVGERQNVPPAQNLLLSRPRWLLIWKLTTATSARWLFDHSNNVYFLLLADPRHQRNDRPVLRRVPAPSPAGARRRLPRCLCGCFREPDRGIKQDYGEGGSLSINIFGDILIIVVRAGMSITRGNDPQTLNMTNRWKKTSEDVQAISAPKVIQLSTCASSLLSKIAAHASTFFSAGHLLLPILHHHSRLCPGHKTQLPPTTHERPRKRKYSKFQTSRSIGVGSYD